MNTLDRLAPMVAGLFVVALIAAGLIYAAHRFVAAMGGVA